MCKRALIFGAGSIGRGFIGELMHLSGFDITLVDVNKELIEKLHKAGHYMLELVSNQEKVVKNIAVKRVIDGNDTMAVAYAVEKTDIIFTAVGQGALKYIAKPIAMGLTLRVDPVNIILCENMMDAHIAFGDMCASHLDDNQTIDKAGFIRASVGRMVPLPTGDSDILTVKAEPYYNLPIDADFIVGTLPDFVGCQKVSPFDYAMERKLFIHNLGHVACAWLGAKKEYTFIYEAVSDMDIRMKAYEAMMESALALNTKYNRNMDELTAHINDLLCRFENIALGDTIRRVGRDTTRKLASNDRAVGALNLCKAMALPYDAIVHIIASGLAFQNDDTGTQYVQDMIASQGLDATLKAVCAIDDPQMIQRIKAYL